MYRSIPILVVLFFLLGITPASAQFKANNYTVRGRVVDAKTKAHLPYALIRIKNTGRYIMSNANGDFEMPIPKSYWRKKKIVFEAKANAYKPNSFEINTKKQKKDDILIFKLSPISTKK